MPSILASLKLHTSIVRPRLGRAALTLGWLLVSATAQAGEFRVIPDVDYLEPGRTEKLDLYVPVLAPDAPRAPAAIWIHGLKGDKSEKRGRMICETLAAAGYVCASINHGPAREFVTNLLDCKNAVRFLRAHADEYHIDADRMAAMGGSMGGYYAVMVGLTPGVEKFAPPLPYPGISDKVQVIVDFYGPIGPPGYRLTDFVNPDSPPVLVLHGEQDTTVPPGMSTQLVEALKSRGVAHQFILLPGIGHSFRLSTTWDDKPLPQDLGPVLLSFLQAHLGTAAGDGAVAAPTK